MAMMTPDMQRNYIASQQNRYNQAVKGGNKTLADKIVADLKRFKYTPINPSPAKPATTSTPQTKKTTSAELLPGLTFSQTNNQMNTNTTMMDKKNDQNTSMTMIDQPSSGQTGKMTSAAQPVYEKNPSGFTYDPSKDARFAQYFATPAAFNYDPKADPLYQTMLQNALAGAKSNAKQAQQNALESLNERGISNSSIAASQLAQIEQDALTGAQSNLESTLLPQLTSLAYQRYQDGIANNRAQAELLRGLSGDAFNQYLASLDNQRADKTLNMQEAGLTGMYDGNKTLDAMNADRQFGLQEAGLTGIYNGQQTLGGKQLSLDQQRLNDEKTRNAAQDTEEKKRWWAEYTRAGQQWAQQNKLDWATLTQRQKELASDEAWKEKNYVLDKDAAAWQKDPNNPLNMQREATAESKGATDRKDYIASQTAEYIKLLRTEDGGIDYKTAVQEINDNVIAGLYTKEEGNQIINALNSAGLKPKEKSTSTYKPTVTGSNMGSIFR
jgi:hypothetical protein